MWNSPFSVQHVQRMLDSFERWLGRSLIDRSGSELEQAERLYRAPFIVVSHGTEPDPVLCYGNLRALELWEMDADAFCRTPSKETAEPLRREERAQILARTTAYGFVSDYRGIRISRGGRRFMIENAIVWNVVSPSGDLVGQAATFSDFHRLDAP